MAVPRNLPNLITGSRVLLGAVLFVFLSVLGAARGTPHPQGLLASVAGHERLLLNTCLAIFLTAAISDVLDGYIARRWGLQTDFGRIVDPFADKLIVCGTFVQLVPLEGSLVASWMVVVILARELLVDGVRGFAESKGIAFPAMWTGKLKMFFQSNCLAWILGIMANYPHAGWGHTLILVLLWATVIMTILSGGQYVLHARRVLSAEALAQLSSGTNVQAGP